MLFNYNLCRGFSASIISLLSSWNMVLIILYIICVSHWFKVSPLSFVISSPIVVPFALSFGFVIFLICRCRSWWFIILSMMFLLHIFAISLVILLLWGWCCLPSQYGISMSCLWESSLLLSRCLPQNGIVSGRFVWWWNIPLVFSIHRSWLIQVKVSFYIAQYPVLSTVQSALHFTSLTDLFTQTTYRIFGEASSHMLQLMREGCSYTYPPLSIARYSFIQLSELEQSRVKKLA